ncbi:MAG TPA: polysaccharide deacetylase family protein [Dermatophilaceae bacterium]|nr:polysaccharide deacetylase family protein [Dermatophilaceae bacterium]
MVDGDVHLDVAVPQLTDSSVLNQRLTSIADRLVSSFRSTVRREGGASSGRYHAMTVGWQLIGRSDRAIGIQLWVAQQHGLRVSIDRSVVWYDSLTQRMLDLPELFLPQAWPAVQEAVARALGEHGHEKAPVLAALSARGSPETQRVAFGFSSDGDLVLSLPAGTLADDRPLSVRLADAPLRSRLSAAGLSAKSAAAHPPAIVAAREPDCAKLKCVALTFDDGPGAFTAELVAILAQREVPATFFAVGNRIAQSPDLLASVHGAGMEIGNHSWDHRELTLVGAADMKRDLNRTSKAIADVTGQRPTLLRPPYGAQNKTVDSVSKQLDLAEILWNVDTLDWLYADAKRVENAAVTSTGRGSIILMHDIHRTTVAAVPGIVANLREQGFTLVTVSQLLGERPVPGQVYRQRAVTGVQSAQRGANRG